MFVGEDTNGVTAPLSWIRTLRVFRRNSMAYMINDVEPQTTADIQGVYSPLDM